MIDNIPSQLLFEEYEFVLSALILIALISFYIFFRNWKQLRFIEDTPTAKLRSAHQGYIEVEGKGYPIHDQLIYAPLSNHQCIWYHSLIEYQETFLHKGRSQARWNIIYQNVSNQQFMLSDGTNSCLVDPDGAKIQSDIKLVWYGNTEWPTTTQILESQSILNIGSKHYRYQERLILPRQSLYIIGQFKTLPSHTNQSVREMMRNLIDNWKKDKLQLLTRFDTNKDGEIDQEEWESARLAAQLQAQQIYLERPVEQDVNIITKPDISQRPFIISVYPQKRLIKKYRQIAFSAFALCLMVMGYIVWLMLTYH